MSLHTWPHQGPCKTSICTIFMLNSQSLASIYPESLQFCPKLCDPEDHGLPGFSGRGFLQARILKRIGQHWLPYPSRALYFLLPKPPAPLRTWCFQNPCDLSSCTTSTPGPHRGKPKYSRPDSEANPSEQPTCRGGNKITIETQGQCG